MVVGNDSNDWTGDNISGNPVKAHVVTMINQGKLFYIQQFNRQLWVGDTVALQKILIFQTLAQITSTSISEDWVKHLSSKRIEVKHGDHRAFSKRNGA